MLFLYIAQRFALVLQISIAMQKYNKKMTYARVHAIFCHFIEIFILYCISIPVTV